MRAWAVDRVGPIDSGPLRRLERDLPEPGQGQLRVRVSCCGVCRTDLHLAEGDLPPKRPLVTPGHEVVGVVDALGPGTPALRASATGSASPGSAAPTGRAGSAARGRENLCEHPVFTGWDLDGGYADACLVDESFAYALPGTISDEHAAPLLCAGIIGYRRCWRQPCPTVGSLGIYGFGGSAHLTAQIALHQGARVHVLTRGEANRAAGPRARGRLGRRQCDAPPEPLDSAILFAPAGELVPVALRALDSGGTLAVAGIWLSDMPPLVYADELFREQRLRSVTANTRADGEEFLRLAQRFSITPDHRGLPDGRGPRRDCPTSPTVASAAPPCCTTELGLDPSLRRQRFPARMRRATARWNASSSTPSAAIRVRTTRRCARTSPDRSPHHVLHREGDPERVEGVGRAAVRRQQVEHDPDGEDRDQRGDEATDVDDARGAADPVTTGCRSGRSRTPPASPGRWTRAPARAR